MIRSRRTTGGGGMAKTTSRYINIAAVGILSILMISSVFILNQSARPDLHLYLSDSSARYMDGLLSVRPEGDVCTSRTEHHLYRKFSEYKPSSYLISKLRRYEKRHQQCAPQAEAIARKLHSLEEWSPVQPRSNVDGDGDDGNGSCKFVVWVAYSGLGNRLVTLAAAFLYALITDRVLLVDNGNHGHMSDLLCEPFPRTSWLLPEGFPRGWLQSMNESSAFRFGSLIDRGRCVPDVRDITSFPKVAYVHLTHDYNVQDRRFFCEAEQELLRNVPWLIMKTNNYFVPGLFFVPKFKMEMEKMFPEEPETIFHHLGRYLLHPSNSVWYRATRFYDAYLSGADKLVGLQLRTFDSSEETQRRNAEQVLDCVISEKILPNVTSNVAEALTRLGGTRKTTSVLVTSLHQLYYEKLRDLYLENPVWDDGPSVVKVHLPSHEVVQKMNSAEHEKKALMEIFLLSFSDVLVTSPMSTFGYVAHGLAGIKPWILRRLEDQEVQSEVCSRVVSLEPCFHSPPLYDCDCNGGRDPSKVLPVVKGCRDVRWGTQVVNP